MMIAGIVVLCVGLFVLAILLPKFSRHPENATQRTLGTGSRTAHKAPGPLGRLFGKPFHSSSRAVGRSGSWGRRIRSRMPF